MLVLLLLLAMLDPDGSNLRNKAAEACAIGYPLVSFTIPVIYLLAWKERASFPWLADLLVTLTCFIDILGNRMDLYDTIVWFDDLMHFANTGMIAAAVIPAVPAPQRPAAPGGRAGPGRRRHGRDHVGDRGVLRLHQRARRADLRLPGRALGDLGLGVLGSVTAALLIHHLWQRGQLREAAPQLEHAQLR